MRIDWLPATRATLAPVLFVLTACAGLSVPPGQDAASMPVLADENFYSLLTADHVDGVEASARVAMAECANTGTVAVEAQGDTAEEVLLAAVTQLQRALNSAGANAYAVQTQRWESGQGPAGLTRLVLAVQGLICSA